LTDPFIARWLKSGLAGKAPPPDGRSRLLATAAVSSGAIRRRWSPAARGGAPMGIAVPPDDWSLGLARQAVLRWFPAMVISYRISH
jgi:hypothetical protein